MTVDIQKLYEALRDHFGTGWQLYPWFASALGDLDYFMTNGDYDSIVQMAINEGFILEQFSID